MLLGNPLAVAASAHTTDRKLREEKTVAPSGNHTESLQVSVIASSVAVKAVSSRLCKLCPCSWKDTQVCLFVCALSHQ